MQGYQTCCEFKNPLWFCKQLPQPTTDDIELRLCGDEDINNEDIPIEIYIRWTSFHYYVRIVLYMHV